MLKDLNFIEIPGKEYNKELVIFALSTCAFCKRAMNHLKNKEIPYKYIYLDEMEVSKKEEIKAELRRQFKKSLIFPFLVVDWQQALTGFVEVKWNEII